MGLSAVMQTALSGLNAATTMLEISANNLANYETRGFKAGSVSLATLAPQTASLGGWNANPIQFGSGVQVVGIDPDRPLGGPWNLVEGRIEALFESGATPTGLSREPVTCIEIEEQREIGDASRRCKADDRAQRVERESAPVALIRQRGVGEPVGDHDRAACERRFDHVRDELCA